MEKKTEGILQIIAAIGIAAAVLYFSGDIAALGGYGYLGAFLIALLSSATILFPAPGWAVVIAMSAALDPIILGVVVGIGSAIGEMTGYLAGEGVRDLMSSRIKESKRMEELVRKYDVAAIFVLAFIPNPLFDVAGVIAGSLKIAWWRYLLSCAAGRILRYILLAFLGAFTLNLLT
ncbi:MAG: VTT domain-containing protein [Candidatus Micrarchaeota archaeon]